MTNEDGVKYGIPIVKPTPFGPLMIQPITLMGQWRGSVLVKTDRRGHVSMEVVDFSEFHSDAIFPFPLTLQDKERLVQFLTQMEAQSE